MKKLFFVCVMSFVFFISNVKAEKLTRTELDLFLQNLTAEEVLNMDSKTAVSVFKMTKDMTREDAKNNPKLERLVQLAKNTLKNDSNYKYLANNNRCCTDDNSGVCKKCRFTNSSLFCEISGYPNGCSCSVMSDDCK